CVDSPGRSRGALQYDIASLLYDAKADLPPELRLQLLDHYLDELAGFIDLGRDAFMQHYYAYVYVRIMQALGAYGFRGFYERKVHFLQSVPYALKNLGWLLGHVQVPIALPTLMDAFKSMVASEKLHGLASEGEHVTVRVFSFSFHRGLPRDESGHGGGFVWAVPEASIARYIWQSNWLNICATGTEWRWWCGIVSWRTWRNESHDSGRWARHTLAATD